MIRTLAITTMVIGDKNTSDRNIAIDDRKIYMYIVSITYTVEKKRKCFYN